MFKLLVVLIMAVISIMATGAQAWGPAYAPLYAPPYYGWGGPSVAFQVNGWVAPWPGWTGWNPWSPPGIVPLVPGPRYQPRNYFHDQTYFGPKQHCVPSFTSSC